MNSDKLYLNSKCEIARITTEYTIFETNNIQTNMKELFIYLFAFLSFLTTAQTDKNELSNKTYEELLAGFAKIENNFELQKKYANAYLLKAKKEKKDLRIAKGYYMMSNIHNFYDAIKYLDSVTIYAEKESNDKFPMVAYYERARKLDAKRDFKLAIENYIQAESWAKKNNDLDYIFRARLAIAIIKSEDMGEISEALELYRQCYKFYGKNKGKEVRYYNSYVSTIFAIADAHRALHQLDSSSYYNRLGYRELESTEFKNERLKGFFILNEGATQCLKGNYKSAIDSIDKALPIMIEYDEQMNQIASYYYYAKSFNGLNKVDKTVKYYEKVDSVYKKLKYITPEFVHGYHYLIKYYKNKGEKEKQLYYLNTLMSIDSVLQVNYKELTRKFKKEYDIPNLMQEKENIIEGLHQDKKSNHGIMIALGGIIMISLFLVMRQTQQKKAYKKRFEALMQTKEEGDNTKIEIETIEEIKDNDLGIVEETANNILKQLVAFEKKKQFLKPNITLNNIAQDFGTNPKYLSTIINTKKEKPFVRYINDLRIDYIVFELKSNEGMRKYTIKAIAEEAGFNNAEAFSSAFFKRTGIKPSYFIKKLIES
ncbi:AraC family transcriptional regulator [Flavobacterium sediminilitoris]|uniref:AraC family transcriptional regulator n=1 Tax=Flavobacterium sediminilitoris TaxID=2024526 RepID=A0ABY4HQD5_9FLAO|nr:MULTISPECIES: helix-turn-helix domain-containing protein [Flavobacterium]UOX34517.1 AraC family transcriptional regulator [Flavobacterium sediminilitoris]